MSVKVVTDKNFKEEVFNTDKTVLIDFWAAWCGPCRMLSPVVDEIASEYQDRLKVCKVNVDEEPELARQFNIVSIPTLIALKDNKIVSKSVGVSPKAEILSMLGI
ncbi:MAG: thioredoxin [Bacillota bacterium]|nr:thioredoxin [Bacillota bacterium]